MSTPPIPIAVETMETALEIAAVFADHALIAFDLMGADSSTQISVLNNLCKIGRWDYLRAELKPGVREAVLEECRKQNINTDQTI